MDNPSNKMISTHDFFPIVQEALSKGQKVIFTVSGTSMMPWIAHNRDQVLLSGTEGKKLKVGDIILFEHEGGNYILHRIYKKEREGVRTIGDACLYEDGLVWPKEIIGVVEKIYRKGKEINCNSLLWRFLFFLWLRLLPIRALLLKLYVIISGLKRSIKNKCNRYGV